MRQVGCRTHLIFSNKATTGAKNIKNTKLGSQRISATGDTFNEVPMTSSRSSFHRSSSNDRSNSFVSFSPKNVISGFKQKRRKKGYHSVPIDHTKPERRKKILTFIIPGGYSGASLSSSTSLSHSPLAFFLLTFPFRFIGAESTVLHTLHSGTLRLRMSVSISVPGTRTRHWRQVAVAKEP